MISALLALIYVFWGVKKPERTRKHYALLILLPVAVMAVATLEVLSLWAVGSALKSAFGIRLF